MADVFISYAREDRLAAQRIAGALQRHGWSVWWDADIPPGKAWDELIERELAAASCAVVLWSATSLRKGWVKAEAADALARGVLLPVLIENVTPPLAFRHVQAAPLMDWRTDDDHGGFQGLLCSVCALAGAPAQPEVAKRPARPAGARGKVASVSMRSARSATPCAAPPAAKPAAEKAAVRPPSPGDAVPPKRQSPPAETSRRQVVASLAALALISAMVGYGVRDTVDRWLEPQTSNEAGRPASGAAAAASCPGPAVTIDPAAPHPLRAEPASL
jgi:hypothetical protein